MNIKNMTTLRDFFLTLPPKAIRMSTWLKTDRDGETVEEAIQHTCGTVGCIAGWAYLLASPPDKVIDPRISPIAEVAAEWLELNAPEADDLFLGFWAFDGLATITQDAVIQRLTKMIDKAKGDLR